MAWNQSFFSFDCYQNKNFHYNDIDGLAQDCSNSSALAMELMQSCAKPSIWSWDRLETVLSL